MLWKELIFSDLKMIKTVSTIKFSFSSHYKSLVTHLFKIKVIAWVNYTLLICISRMYSESIALSSLRGC